MCNSVGLAVCAMQVLLCTASNTLALPAWNVTVSTITRNDDMTVVDIVAAKDGTLIFAYHLSQDGMGIGKYSPVRDDVLWSSYFEPSVGRHRNVFALAATEDSGAVACFEVNGLSAYSDFDNHLGCVRVSPLGALEWSAVHVNDRYFAFFNVAVLSSGNVVVIGGPSITLANFSAAGDDVEFTDIPSLLSSSYGGDATELRDGTIVVSTSQYIDDVVALHGMSRNGTGLWTVSLMGVVTNGLVYASVAADAQGGFTVAFPDEDNSIVVCKMSSVGVVLWCKTLSGDIIQPADRGVHIEESSKGGVVVACDTRGSISGGILFIRLSANGNLVTASSIGGNLNSWPIVTTLGLTQLPDDSWAVLGSTGYNVSILRTERQTTAFVAHVNDDGVASDCTGFNVTGALTIADVHVTTVALGHSRSNFSLQKLNISYTRTNESWRFSNDALCSSSNESSCTRPVTAKNPAQLTTVSSGSVLHEVFVHCQLCSSFDGNLLTSCTAGL